MLGLLLAAAVPAMTGTAPAAQAAPEVDVALLTNLSARLAEATMSSGLVEFAMVPGLTVLSAVVEPEFAYPKPALKTMALTVVPLDQFPAFDQIITHESSWRVFAVNPSSGAYGLAQALPAHKMSSEGVDWLINPMTQLRWAYRYMVQRYGSPNAAWEFWQANHWY
ncbi:transglycosylase SLT domain-containing protein [Nocardia yamanashiensis]|uniref:aggregation-promoting factor C-terminal-like domain-containing protein n=1 Tax=Nocardia yamanashiensis TaxID=209247 RepID=UPI0008298919|nr:transglycosylase SLT domain-containing protein [Nocardia yamanashiensis]UGT39351.1 transglycosylase SLT domain-containing protein [Nocardia yamanashiensis]